MIDLGGQTEYDVAGGLGRRSGCADGRGKYQGRYDRHDPEKYLHK